MGTGRWNYFFKNKFVLNRYTTCAVSVSNTGKPTRVFISFWIKSLVILIHDIMFVLVYKKLGKDVDGIHAESNMTLPLDHKSSTLPLRHHAPGMISCLTGLN